MLVLDEDEFEALPISEEEHASVRAALEDLQNRAREGLPPFMREA